MRERGGAGTDGASAPRGRVRPWDRVSVCSLPPTGTKPRIETLCDTLSLEKPTSTPALRCRFTQVWPRPRGEGGDLGGRCQPTGAPGHAPAALGPTLILVSCHKDHPPEAWDNANGELNVEVGLEMILEAEAPGRRLGWGQRSALTTDPPSHCQVSLLCQTVSQVGDTGHFHPKGTRTLPP